MWKKFGPYESVGIIAHNTDVDKIAQSPKVKKTDMASYSRRLNLHQQRSEYTDP